MQLNALYDRLYSHGLSGCARLGSDIMSISAKFYESNDIFRKLEDRLLQSINVDNRQDIVVGLVQAPGCIFKVQAWT